MFIAEDPTLISIHANPLYPANIPPTRHNQLACVQNTACLLTSGTFCSLNIYSRGFFHCAYRLCQVYASYSCQRMSFGVSLITFIVGWFTGWNQLPFFFFYIPTHKFSHFQCCQIGILESFDNTLPVLYCRRLDVMTEQGISRHLLTACAMQLCGGWKKRFVHVCVWHMHFFQWSACSCLHAHIVFTCLSDNNKGSPM